MPTAYGYTRVSTADQADEGQSLEGQTRRIEAAYRAKWKDKGYDLGEVFEDRATSGKVPLFNRKHGFRLSQTVNRGDVVIFAKLDRGFRNTIDALTVCETWEEMGVKVVFLDLDIDLSTPFGQAILAVMAAFAKWERQRIAERVKEGLADRKRKGFVLGRPPITLAIVGKKEKARFEVVPEEYRIGRAIIDWRDKGFSWGEITKHLNDNAVPRPAPRRKVAAHYLAGFRGDHWTDMAVRRYYLATLRTRLMIAEGKVKEPVLVRPA